MKNLALFTDLYELTMAASYYDHGMFEPATFSLFIRKYPTSRRYFISAGLADVLDYLKDLKFASDDLNYLEETGLFKPGFLSYLEKFRFTGDVFAIPEGRLFFVNEPIIEITAPLIESQIVETFIINAINLQVMIATKASRCVHVAWPRKLVDFSLRRTHGIDAGMKVARASFIGGFEGTSNVLAGKIYGIPIFGTMAHSFVISFEKEIDAFRAFAQSFPENVVLLVDTYDTVSGTVKAAEVGREMALKGQKLKGVRLDSGDIALLSRKVRKILKRTGLRETTIFASGAFDEYKIQRILDQAGDIDSFGVGTKMGVSADAPYLDMAYKLVKYAGRPVLKLSPEKITLASEKQIFRFTTSKGKLKRDVIGLREDKLEGGEPLLNRVMTRGKVISEFSDLFRIQKIFLDEFSKLDFKLKSLEKKETEYRVSLSPRLKSLQSKIINTLKAKELGES
ncbi:MAG: nicotinate phosphoribosyltransferase [Candidatus Aminicenantes bacterium]|nr:nicotinate phosphoribosyltransferase [Candidatus Aminicenantes bacterium]